jgi:L-amino acid N-acyltransferase YncA
MTHIRTATTGDCNEMLEMYAPYILNTSLTFETEVPAEKDFCKRITSYLQRWPWIVCEIDGNVAGYAYASRHRERTAYQWSVESSVYIGERFHRRRIATALYKALFEVLKWQGFRNVYAGINLPNEPSVLFHESCGFEWFASYKNVGYKLGRWKTVGWWQLQLNDYSEDPAAPLYFPEIESHFLEKVYHENAKIAR